MTPAKTALIEGRRVRLVPADDSMVDRFHAWISETDNRHLIGGTAYPISRASEAEFLRAKQSISWNDGVFLAIEAVDREEPILIGSVELRQFHAESRSCEVGIMVGAPAYRGGGYGTEAMRLACCFAFDEMGVERVGLSTSEFNTRAVRSYEKVGFVVEGRRRRGVYIDGRYYDVIVMGLLREEFRDASADGRDDDE